MIRRPLAQYDMHWSECVNAWDALKAAFGFQVNRSWLVCPESLYRELTYIPFFQRLGFEAMPVGDVLQDQYPKTAPDGCHPTFFLQWGARIESKDHVIFEIGDTGTLISFRFKENYCAEYDTSVYQLDELKVETQNVVYALDCGNADHHQWIDDLFDVVGQTVSLMNADRWSEAQESYSRVDQIIRHIDENNATAARLNAGAGHPAAPTLPPVK